MADAPRRPGRLAVVDGLRIFAALMVVAFHYLALPGEWREPMATNFPHTHVAASFGWLGVELFFLISGFVICMSCWGRTVSQFAVSRFVRLYPAYWFAVILTTVVVTALAGGLEPVSRIGLLANATMLSTSFGYPYVDPVYWTLSVELHFYVIFAFVAWRGLTYWKVVGFCTAWGALGGAFLLLHVGPGVVHEFVDPEYCWYFIGGVAFFLIHKFGPRWPSILLVLGSLAVALPTIYDIGSQNVPELGFTYPMWPVPALVIAFYAAMALVASRRLDNLRWRWFGVAGAATYPLYLIHEYVGWEIIGRLQDRLDHGLLVLILVVVMLVAAWVLHEFVENPIATLLRRVLTPVVTRVFGGPSGRHRPGRTVPAHDRPTVVLPKVTAEVVGSAPEQEPVASRV